MLQNTGTRCAPPLSPPCLVTTFPPLHPHPPLLLQCHLHHLHSLPLHYCNHPHLHCIPTRNKRYHQESHRTLLVPSPDSRSLQCNDMRLVCPRGLKWPGKFSPVLMSMNRAASFQLPQWMEGWCMQKDQWVSTVAAAQMSVCFPQSLKESKQSPIFPWDGLKVSIW